MSKALKNKVKLNNVVDVVADFGADPTGVSDSTTAIQNAINYAKLSSSLSLGDYATVYVPKGTYSISQILLHNVHLKGDGAVITPRSASPCIYIADTAPQNGRERTKISGMGFLGSVASGIVTRAIHIDHAFNVWIEGCSFQTWQGDAVYNSQGESIWIENCSWQNGAQGHCVAADSSLAGTFTNNITISQCRFNGIGGFATYPYPAVRLEGWSLNVIDSLFVGCRGGGIIISQYNNSMGVKISGNYFENNGWNDKQHIQLGSSGGFYPNGVEISSNMMLGTGSSGANMDYAILIWKANGVNIHSNQINNSVGNYNYAPVYAVNTTSNDISVVNNYFVLESGFFAINEILTLCSGFVMQTAETGAEKIFGKVYSQKVSKFIAGAGSLASTYTLYYPGVYEVTVMCYRSDGFSRAIGTWQCYFDNNTGTAMAATNLIGATLFVGNYTAITLSAPVGGVVTATVTQTGTAFSATMEFTVRMISPLYH